MLRTLRISDLGLVFLLYFSLWDCSHTRISAVEYGPSLASLTGVFVNWKGPDIWSLESGRRVKLSQYPSFATVIPLITDNSQATSEQIFQERGISTVGEFVVEAPPTFGLIAVIQELKLRKSTRDRGYNSSSCLDYIQFAELKPTGLGNVTPKICGTVHRDDTSIKPTGVIGPRTFMSSGGKIRIAFNHAYVSELVDALLAGSSQRKKPVLKVEIAFTAYTTNCSEEYTVGTNGTAEESGMEETFEACNDYSTMMNQTCINSKLLCDEIYNCGGDNDTLGSDEHQALCPDKPARTTEKEDESESDQTERPSPLANLLNLGSYYSSTHGSQSPFQEQRKFKPYVPPSESAMQQEGLSSKRRMYSSSSRSSQMSQKRNNESSIQIQESETDQPPPASASGESLVRPVGAYSSKTSGGDVIESPPKRMDLLNHENDPGYGRRELADAINSVIYGVALFIVFTIFITLFVIYIGRRIQMNLSQRSNSRSSIAPVVRGSVSTPSIRPSTTTAVITRDNASCNGAQSRELAFSSSNTTVVLVTLPQQTQNSEGYDPPPSYDTLFPQPNQNVGRC